LLGSRLELDRNWWDKGRRREVPVERGREIKRMESKTRCFDIDIFSILFSI
jgi:hypothetical protein